jgi:iron complex transport system substrate-binding protein
MNRRHLVLSTASAIAGASYQRVGAQGTPASSPVISGAWSFVDDRGREIRLDHVPQRLFCEVQAALSLLDYGIMPVGMVGYGGVYAIPEVLADLPLLDLAESGGEFDVEAVAAMRPDLSIGITWDVNSKADFGGFQEEGIPGFTDLAPTACILGVIQPADVSIERFAELARSLGADTETTSIAESRAAFDAASQAVRDAVAAKPGLKVLVISPTEDACWIGNPEVASDLVFFRNLGVDFIVPESPDGGNSGLFQELSWEQLGSYPADLFLIDDRPYSLQPEDLESHPVFSLLPAAQAKQFGSWTVEYVTTYHGVTTLLQNLAAAIEASEIVTA